MYDTIFQVFRAVSDCLLALPHRAGLVGARCAASSRTDERRSPSFGSGPQEMVGYFGRPCLAFASPRVHKHRSELIAGSLVLTLGFALVLAACPGFAEGPPSSAEPARASIEGVVRVSGQQ